VWRANPKALGQTLTPRGEVVPQEWNLPPRGKVIPLGVKFSVRPSILLNSRECSPLNKSVNIPPGRQISPLWPSSPLWSSSPLEPSSPLGPSSTLGANFKYFGFRICPQHSTAELYTVVPYEVIDSDWRPGADRVALTPDNMKLLSAWVSSRINRREENHRNLRTRTSMLAQALQFFWERTPGKKVADLHPRQGNILQRNNFSGVYETFLYSWKNSPFFFF
jgi:hypothetical protein